MGQVADPEGLGNVIKGALEGREASKSRIVCSPPGLRIVSRIINLPSVNTKELDSIVPREVRRLMTVSEEDNHIYWQALPSETSQTPVLVLAVAKEALNNFMETLRIGGVRPHRIDLKPMALMRAVNQQDAIIANGESNSVELVIVVNDVPVQIRSIFLGEGVVTQDYAVGRISDELVRTITTYNEINSEHPLDPEIPVFLCGAMAASVSFAMNVAALTGRTVQPLEPPLRCPEDFPLARFMVNVGLILKTI
jgi:Tfp pilus assembly PilM family ATPase